VLEDLWPADADGPDAQLCIDARAHLELHTTLVGASGPAAQDYLHVTLLAWPTGEPAAAVGLCIAVAILCNRGFPT
jgi:hypothetical protein